MKSNENRTQYWREHLAAFHKSGMSQKAYCQYAKIGYWSFNQWKKSIEKQKNIPAITEVRTRPATLETLQTENRIEIYFNKSLHISVPAKVDSETISIIIKLLGESTCR